MSYSSRLVSALQLGDFGAGGADQLVIGVGMSFEAPSPCDRLSEDHPGPVSQRWITGRARCQLSQLANHGNLLLALRQRASIGSNLDAHVIRIAIDVAERSFGQFVHEGRRVLAE